MLFADFRFYPQRLIAILAYCVHRVLPPQTTELTELLREEVYKQEGMGKMSRRILDCLHISGLLFKTTNMPCQGSIELLQAWRQKCHNSKTIAW